MWLIEFFFFLQGEVCKKKKKKNTADRFVRALACFGLFYIFGWAPKAADESVWTVIAEVLHSDCLNSKQCLDTQCTRQMAQLPVYKVNSKIETLNWVCCVLSLQRRNQDNL